VCLTRYHYANGWTGGLGNGSTAGLAGLVDRPLLGCVENKGRGGGGLIRLGL
jgi:hypothetical protein